ncbi:MAG: RHS repeat protein, partial [Actinobacteria bacterium]|nr:RHS repeat protein [Actinomycetota bacterium]
MLTETAWSPPDPLPGEKIIDYPSSTTAVMDLPDEKADAVIESVGGPIAVRSGSEYKPIDLSLALLDGTWKPKNAPAPISFPVRLSDPIRISGAGGAGEMEVRPAAGSAAGLLQDDDKLFYANSFTDTDTIAEAVPNGTQISWTLRSPAAPENLPLGIHLSVGVTYKLENDGSASLMFGDSKVATVAPPTAWDAQHQPVDVRYEVTDTGLNVKAEHRSRDLAYPVVVDPYLNFYGVYSFREEDTGGAPFVRPWLFSSNPTNYITGTQLSGSTPYVLRTMTKSWCCGSAWWAYDAPRESTVFRAEFTSVVHNANHSTLLTGIYGRGNGWADSAWGAFVNNTGCVETSLGNVPGCQGGGPFGNSSGMASTNATIACAAAGCGMGGSVDNIAPFQLNVTGPQTGGDASASFTGGYLYFSDYQDPTLYGTPNGGAWETTDAISISAGDNGVGLTRSPWNERNRNAISIVRDGVLQQNYGGGPSCYGGADEPCPNFYTPPGNYPLAEGVYTYQFRSADMVGRENSQTRTLRVDRTAPTINLTGRLNGLLEADSLWGNPSRIPRTISRTTPFSIHVDDHGKDDGATARSGVKTAYWSVTNAATDGSNNFQSVVVSYPTVTQITQCDGSAAQKNCAVDFSGSINPQNLSPGVYYLNVSAVDGVGKTVDRSYKFAIGVGDITSVSEGVATSRYIPLQAEQNRAGLTPAPTSARFQWRRIDGTWQGLPLAAMKLESDGSAPQSTWFNLGVNGCTSAVAANCTPRVVVDLEQLSRNGSGAPGSANDRLRDGMLVFRAIFNHDASVTDQERSSEDVAVELDRGGRDTKDDSANLGLGSVDLMSGNISMSANDFSQDAYRGALSISRSYASRYASTRDDRGVARPISPLGPGWSINLPTQSAQYSSLVDNADIKRDVEQQMAFVQVLTVDGAGISFELSATPNDDGTDRYLPEPGMERLKLERQAGATPADTSVSFKLTDLDSNVVTTFGQRDTVKNDGTYLATKVDNPGSAKDVTYSYDTVAPNALSPSTQQLWPSRMLAPEPGTTAGSCSASNMGATPDAAPVAAARGCQSLDFKYSDVTVDPPNTPDGIQWGGAPWKPISGDWNGDGVDSIGMFRPDNGNWYLSDTPAVPNSTMRILSTWGSSGDLPIAGDWDGDGKDSLGLFRPSTATWFLTNSNTNPGGSPYSSVAWGMNGDVPVAGDWDGDGKDTIGIFRPSTGVWYLSNSNTSPTADAAQVQWGGTVPPWKPMTGDWNNDGKDGIGLYRPDTSQWYLSDTIKSPNDTMRIVGPWADSSMEPIAGDWNNDGITTIGAFQTSSAKWYLSNSNTNPSTAALTTQKRLTSVYLKTWDPSAGSNGAMTSKEVARYSYDNYGRLKEQYDPRLDVPLISTPLKTAFEYDSNNLLTKATPPGESPMSVSYATGPYDLTAGRVKDVSRIDPNYGTANWAVRYGVPISGSGAPYDMSKTQVSKWAQSVPPLQATAVFPPDQQPNGDSPTNWGVSQISYLDPLGREVNNASPGGRISTTEYTRTGQVSRTLTPANREKAMQQADTVAASRKWDTQNTFQEVPYDGSERMIDSIGPEHPVKLAKPQQGDPTGQVSARTHTRITYDEGAPGTTAYSLPTTTTVSAQLTDGTDRDAVTTKKEYDWNLRATTAEISDAGSGGLAIKRQFVLNSIGQEIERRQPIDPGTASAGSADVPTTTVTTYYSAGTENADADCNNRPEWRGLVCKVGPPANTPASAKLVTKWVQKYDLNRQPLQICELSGARTISSSGSDLCPGSSSVSARVSTSTYDSIGRPASQSMNAGAASPSIGRAVPTIRHNYSAATGRETSTDSLNGSTLDKSITHTFDALGRETAYQDANGNISTTAYDILSRPVTTNDGKSTQTRSYDPVTGDLTGLTDSQTGSTGANYDADGRPLAQTLPGGLIKSHVYDADGNVTELSYFKSTNCSSACTWYSNQVTRTARDQIIDDTDTFGQKQYTYDTAGRLTMATDTRNGKCNTRRYAYDADSNRTSQTAAASSTATCDTTGGTTRTRTYDSGYRDRLADPGYVYDDFGRATTTPAADAGSTGAMTATYYQNDLASSITQAGITQTLDLDPALRAFKKTKTVGTSTTIENY